MNKHGRTLAAAAVAALLLAATSLGAQAPSSERVSPGEWIFGGSIGTGGVGGDYGEIVEKPIDFDLNLARGRGRWRFGGGLQFGSLLMKPPSEDQQDWSRMEVRLFATRVFRHESKVRPYLQVQASAERLHPRSEVFYVIPEEEIEAGENPTEAANGFGFSLRPGVEIELKPALALDLSAAWTVYKTGDLSMEAIGREPLSSGNEWAVRAGLVWRPLAEGVKGAAPADHRPGYRQAAAAAARGRPARCLGRLAQLGLGHGRDAGHQLRRHGPQRVGAPARALPRSRPARSRRTSSRASSTTTTSSRPTSSSTPSTAAPTSTRPAPTASASGARRSWPSPGPSSGSAAARASPCRGTT